MLFLPGAAAISLMLFLSQETILSSTLSTDISPSLLLVRAGSHSRPCARLKFERVTIQSVWYILMLQDPFTVMSSYTSAMHCPAPEFSKSNVSRILEQCTCVRAALSIIISVCSILLWLCDLGCPGEYSNGLMSCLLVVLWAICLDRASIQGWGDGEDNILTFSLPWIVLSSRSESKEQHFTFVIFSPVLWRAFYLIRKVHPDYVHITGIICYPQLPNRK